VRHVMLFVVGSTLGMSALHQASSQTTVNGDAAGPGPSYRVVEISRTVQAVNYRHRSGASEIGFAGTALLPSAMGTAKVRSKRGTLEVEAEFENLQNPNTFGSEYLTYVLWAISPEGRPVNLGEVLVAGNDRSKLTATTDLQAFALIVTAEPYYAVRQPSNVVVLENVIRAETKGSTEEVDAKYELLERGGYLPTGYKFDPIVLNANLPLEFYEARNALRIAQSEGADRYASESYQRAVQQMTIADNDATRGHVEKKLLIAAAREAVQTAEDAREIAVKRIEGDRQAAERQASADAQVRAQAEADRALQLKEQAQADAARAQAEAAKAQADAAANQAASAAAVAASQAAADKAQADAARAQADSTANQAASAAAIAASQAAADKAQADAARAQAESATNQAASAAAIAAAQADADKARLIAQQADSDKAAMRAQLSLQLNRILQTRDSARGLIVSMSDVLFDTGRYSLKPGAREKLAKVAGILMAYPSLNIEVGGYTDNVGGDDMNQRLSENRAAAVRDYLVQQGVGAETVTAKGFGNGMPVATNDNAAGRQANRRVELLVSGDAIGTPLPVTTGSLN
jgi:outer membrane protein OmpA-like peptidoglycan-associated protein